MKAYLENETNIGNVTGFISPNICCVVKNFCTPESKNAEACIEIYQPVCGWNDPEKIQCIKFPCANTYSNSCFACMDEDVLYYTEGECPK